MDFPVNEDGWPLSPDGYELLVEIGQGAFAKVIKARCPSKDTFVAVKVMALENITTSLEEIQAEVRTMKLSKNENVLDLYCCFVVKSDLWLVMPHMDKGSCYYALRMLRKLGKLHEGQGLSEDIISIILREVLAGLDYIHGQHQIHRDVKAGNILLNAEGRIAIADFGVAGWLSEAGARSEGERKTFVGTPCWMAPEVMEQQHGYNEKADIWSVGITALELLKGYAPYSKYAPMQVLIKTIREPPPSIRSYVEPAGTAPPSDKFNKFVARCLQKDPRQRPSAHELLSDPFFKRGGMRSSAKAGLPESFLHDVPEVGSPEAVRLDTEGKPKGYGPLDLKALVASGGVSLVPGTTWVFPGDASGDARAFAGAGGDEQGGSTGLEEGSLDMDALGDALAELGGETNT